MRGDRKAIKGAIHAMVNNSSRFYGHFLTASDRKRWLWERFEHIRTGLGIDVAMDEKQRLFIKKDGAVLYDSENDALDVWGLINLATEIYATIDERME